MNKIKSAYKYQLYEHIRPMIIYYLIFISIIVASFIAMHIEKNQMSTTDPYLNINVSGSDLSTIIFIFIIGIVALKESFGMMMQNSVSRKSVFIGRIFTCITIAIIMAMVDNILVLVCKNLIVNIDSNSSWTTLFENLYCLNCIGTSDFMLFFENFIYSFLLYLCFISLGYTISLIFYRVNKVIGLIIKIGVPITVTFILPTFDSLFTDGKICEKLIDVLDMWLGVSSHQPIYAIITFTIGFLILSGISWLLIRRAVVTD